MSLAEAVKNGNELEILIETRKKIAAQMDECDNGHDLSSLSDKMVKLCERITELEKQQKPKRKTALDSVRKVRK
ncbi:MAG TPA: hypothetical protein DCP91_03490 [Eggerthellaceae bacterium]|nr:hypothetical protein [Eggerthellaceae bacterium]